MGACLVLAPVLIASWPAITAAVTAAVSSMGFSLAQKSMQEPTARRTSERVDIAVDNSEVLEAAHVTGEQIVIEKGGIRGTFSRNARGELKLCMEGKNMTEAQLRALGEELIGRVTQQYIYHRVVTEMKKRNMAVVDEQVTADQTVKIRLRGV